MSNQSDKISKKNKKEKEFQYMILKQNIQMLNEYQKNIIKYIKFFSDTYFFSELKFIGTTTIEKENIIFPTFVFIYFNKEIHIPFSIKDVVEPYLYDLVFNNTKILDINQFTQEEIENYNNKIDKVFCYINNLNDIKFYFDQHLKYEQEIKEKENIKNKVETILKENLSEEDYEKYKTL